MCLLLGILVETAETSTLFSEKEGSIIEIFMRVSETKATRVFLFVSAKSFQLGFVILLWCTEKNKMKKAKSFFTLLKSSDYIFGENKYIHRCLFHFFGGFWSGFFLL